MRLTLYFDGACEPRNPGGVATYGWFLLCDGRQISQGHGEVCRGPRATNNVAEWCALGHGLRWILDHLSEKAKRANAVLQICGDSKLVVCQLMGDWKCNKPHLIRLRDRCLEILAQVSIRWSADWIPRERNAKADELSKLAYFEATGKQPPERRKKKGAYS